MDESRDIQGQDGLSKFLDRQEVQTNPFGANRSGERLYRRAERLVAALHILTNHISENEPLRREIRHECLQLLPEILDIRDDMRAFGSPKTGNIVVSIRNLISLVKMLAVAAFISTQNAEAVTGALDEIGSYLLASSRTPIAESIRFLKEDLVNVRESSTEFVMDVTDKTKIKDNRVLRDTEGQKTNVQYGSSMHTPITRSEKIMAILGSQGEQGIRDIASNLPEYSEKMIQRELMRLVTGGKVKKTGFKRWSKYSIAIIK